MTVTSELDSDLLRNRPPQSRLEASLCDDDGDISSDDGSDGNELDGEFRIVPLGNPDPPALPSGIFTGWLQDHVEATAIATETPPELSAAIAMAALATAAQGKFCIRPEPDYFESLSMYVAAFLPSGQRKSEVLKRFIKPMIEFERREAGVQKEKIKKAQSQRKTIELQLKEMRKKAAKLDGDAADELLEKIATLEVKMPELPMLPRLFTQDCTVEHLGTMLSQHDERMAIYSDEGGIFDLLAGRYSNSIPNLDLVLQAYTGSPVRVDRGSRPCVMLNHPSLTIAVTPQPDVARGLASKPGFRGRGLLARFVYVMPISNLGHRKLVPRPSPGHIASTYAEYMTRLLALPLPSAADHETPAVLTLGEAAYAHWKTFQREVEAMMRKDGRLEKLTDYGGKLPGHCARIAGLLHIADYASATENRTVEGGTMLRAITFTKFFLEHALIVFGSMESDASLTCAKMLWDQIVKLNKQSFTAREAWLSLRGTYPRMDDVAGGYQVLIERNWLLEPDDDDDRRRPGRPSRTLTINPDVWKGFAHIAHGSGNK